LDKLSADPNFVLEELPLQNTTWPSNKLFNFEYCLLTGESVNMKKELNQMCHKINSKSAEYTHKILSPSFSILGDKNELRLNIGHVFHGGFSQIRGKGIGLGFIEQPKEIEALQNLKS
jgi:hypothetical protein